MHFLKAGRTGKCAITSASTGSFCSLHYHSQRPQFLWKGRTQLLGNSRDSDLSKGVFLGSMAKEKRPKPLLSHFEHCCHLGRLFHVPRQFGLGALLLFFWFGAASSTGSTATSGGFGSFPGSAKRQSSD